MIIRDEAPSDWPSVDDLLRQAFSRADEADLVRRLRMAQLVAVNLVAESEGSIIGQLCMSWLPTEVDQRPVRAVALAPVSVRPDRQGQGIGSVLVQSGLDAAKLAGAETAIVLGHPTYYPRFGFSAVLASKLASPFPRDAFMALELTPGALSGTRGSVSYPAAFGL